MLSYQTPVKFSQKASLSSSQAQLFKSSLPVKPGTTKLVIMIKNLMEEIKFLNTVIWRQNTSMPIVQVFSFKNEAVDGPYPRAYTIQVQLIEKSIRDLDGIQMAEALYLIQQCLLGVQTISYKYHCFDFHSVYYGLNQKGECRAWISDNLLAHQVNPLPLPKEEIIIGHIVKMIYNLTNNAAKRQLFQFVQQTEKHINIGFSDLHLKLNQFANHKGILIPSSIFIERRASLFSQTRSQILNQTRSQQKNSQYKIKFSFQSPLPKYCTQSQIKQDNSQKNQWTHNICQSQIFGRYSPGILSNQQRFSNFQVSVGKIQRHVSVEKMLMKSHILKNKLKMSKDSFKGSSVKGSIKGSMKGTKQLDYSFGPQDKSQKTCTSRTFPIQNLLKNPPSFNSTSLNNPNNQSRKQILTSVYLSGQYIPQGKQKKNTTCESPHFTNKQNGYFANFRNYNFGGILPLPEKSIKQSQVVQQQIFDQHQQKTFTNLRKGKDKVLKSMVLSQTDVKYHYQNVGWDWDNKMSKLITEDQGNLKQSVYCGQEKRAEHLQIKLQMLGKLGRQITSTVMHEH